MTSVSTLSKPGTLCGRPASVSERCARRPAPGRRTGPRIGRVAAVAARGVPAVEVAAAVGLDQVEELPLHVRLRAPERERALVDVPHEQALPRQRAIRAHASAVL